MTCELTKNDVRVDQKTCELTTLRVDKRARSTERRQQQKNLELQQESDDLRTRLNSVYGAKLPDKNSNIAESVTLTGQLNLRKVSDDLEMSIRAAEK
ncbi:hypothetical protein DPMN_117340 [Dreissena polymorpha]|uniref:Uncharacterized protein n=1 Tax=Dreissena polymorpha TaxID=45954 RepID=A0A9D4QUC4_DREPO|nr:hypothetical protein DPMN_117340 [Dreissena polymorpha]